MLAVAPCRAQDPGDNRPIDEQPWAGLLVRDQAEGLVVGWVLPGPLEGTTFKSPKVNRGDVILSVNGTVMDEKGFKAFLAAAHPGDVVNLKLRRTGSAVVGATPKPGTGAQVQTVSFTLAKKKNWSGPIKFRRKADDLVDPTNLPGVTDEPTAFEAYLQKHLEAQGLVEPIDKLKQLLWRHQRSSFGANALTRVAMGFRRPTIVPELQAAITDPLFGLPKAPLSLFDQAAANLDVPARDRPAVSYALAGDTPEKLLEDIDRVMNAPAGHVEAAFKKIPAERRVSLRKDLLDVIDQSATLHYLSSHKQAGRLLAALRETMKVDFGELLEAGRVLSEAGLSGKPVKLPEAKPIKLPEELDDQVTGRVLGARKTDHGWIVIGGPEANRYVMDRICAVVDLGGNDRYNYAKDVPRPATLVVDYAGNDHHDGDAAAPAGARMGASVIVDHGGNDRYRSGKLSCGAAVLGTGVLYDLAGDDTYDGTVWSCGAVAYGLGAIVDNAGNDRYTSHILSQGLGGPRGFGLIADARGRDLYRVNGPVGSAYGTAAVYCAFSQALGYGFRMYDTGGIGVIVDGNGHDRYEAGEFAQGGSYYWGMGILRDRSGNDLYYGNRYAQGFGCHQGIGLLVDDAGDDTYWSMTAAGQGASWDIALGMLLDKKGNDAYRADGIGQGGASMQAIAWLIDLEGTDRYTAPDRATHGNSGGNSYHYKRSGCFSWSLLLDTGGTVDTYATGRKNGTVLKTGKLNEKKKANSPLNGLFIDTPEKQDPFTP